MKFFTVDEFACIVKLSPFTIRNAIKKGKIYAFRPGVGIRSPYRIPASELERIQLADKYRDKE